MQKAHLSDQNTPSTSTVTNEKLDAILTQLTTLVEINMAMMVQMTKIYDLTVWNTVNNGNTDNDTLAALKRVLDGHEGGFMATSEPVLRAFAAPDPTSNPPTYDPEVEDDS